MSGRSSFHQVRDGTCSETDDRLVEELRTDDNSIPAFAVGFVSVLSGTLLAAELWLAALDEFRNWLIRDAA